MSATNIKTENSLSCPPLTQVNTYFIDDALGLKLLKNKSQIRAATGGEDDFVAALNSAKSGLHEPDSEGLRLIKKSAEEAGGEGGLEWLATKIHACWDGKKYTDAKVAGESGGGKGQKKKRKSPFKKRRSRKRRKSKRKRKRRKTKRKRRKSRKRR